MNSAPDITILSLILCLLLLIVPAIVNKVFRLKLGRSIVISVFRMTIQLFLAGVYLKYLFQWNNPFVNLGWFVIMLIVAVSSVTRTSELNIRRFASASFVAMLISMLLVVTYFNYFVIRIGDIMHAKYFIVIGGMLLGNSLRGNIISVTSFYQSLNAEKNQYQYRLALGATHREALLPYFQRSLHAAFKPMLATMLTTGIVAIPGMMSGQILGGSSPIVAIKYQITIIIAIFVSLNISVALTLLFSIRSSFDGYGILRDDVFRIPNKKRS